jgi:glycerol kinase
VYALEGAIFIAGAAIQWLRDGLKLIKRASESEALARTVPDTAGVYFVPAFVGLGAPYWDQNARGSIYGITRGTKTAHLARAALEAMCYQTKDVLVAMQKDSGLKVKALKVDGGAVANNVLCQFQSDLLGIFVVRPKVIEITSLGAAYLAGMAVGYWKSSKSIRKYWQKDKHFQPRMSKATANELYDGWQKVVARTLTR